MMKDFYAVNGSRQPALAQDYIQGSGHHLGGFNSRINDDTEQETAGYPNPPDIGEMRRAGWHKADKLCRDGKVWFEICSDRRARQYRTVRVMKDGDTFFCIGDTFTNLQESDDYTFGDTFNEAINLFRTTKMKNFGG